MEPRIRRIWLAALTATLLLPSALVAQSGDNDGCKNGTLSGDYSFRVSGAILPPVSQGAPPVQIQRDGVAMTHFDGKGKLTQVDFVMSNGVPLPGPADPLTGFHIGESGWYKVNPDCTGMAEIDFPTPPGGTSGAVIDLMFVLGNRGRSIHTIVSRLVPPNSTTPVAVSIHSDGEKLGRD
jgi:hypothetical protein